MEGGLTLASRLTGNRVVRASLAGCSGASTQPASTAVNLDVSGARPGQHRTARKGSGHVQVQVALPLRL